MIQMYLKFQATPTTFLQATLLCSAILMTGCGGSDNDDGNNNQANNTVDTRAAVISTYSDIASAAFTESLELAQALQTAINTFLADPTEANLNAAKEAYTAARKPYSQSEVFRFDEGFVSDIAVNIASVEGWEGQLNAWPLDEALIDYVSSNYSGSYDSATNVINSDTIDVAGHSVDVSTLSQEIIVGLNELGGSEANVATGYHAIEFLLWGQDVNGISAGAGNRPVSDYYQQASQGDCTSGSTVNEGYQLCAKRADYLTLVTQQLLDDLTLMVSEWEAGSSNTLRDDIAARAKGNALQYILYGMGSLALGELASERMQVALVAGSPEDEHDCFSDTTHFSYANNAQAIENLYYGTYTNQEGTEVVSGSGIRSLLASDTADRLDTKFADVKTAFQAIVNSAEVDGVAFDQLIATLSQAAAATDPVDQDTQTRRRQLVSDAVTSLQSLTEGIEMAAAELGIESLDADGGSQFGQ